MDEWLDHFARAAFARSADTAHDLKTPLNIAVLNLELLRMRVRKLTSSDDEKMTAYARAIELELRRMAEIFDTFFFLSTPPRNEGEPQPIDAAILCRTAAQDAGYQFSSSAAAMVRGHEARIRQAFKMFFQGASSVLGSESRQVSDNRTASSFVVSVTGVPAAADFELTKIFKFYYTDAAGNPDLSLAAARLIAETYGGELNAVQESDKVSINLSLPLGDR